MEMYSAATTVATVSPPEASLTRIKFGRTVITSAGVKNNLDKNLLFKKLAIGTSEITWIRFSNPSSPFRDNGCGCEVKCVREKPCAYSGVPRRGTESTMSSTTTIWTTWDLEEEIKAGPY
jgi:hypothetical protein